MNFVDLNWQHLSYLLMVNVSFLYLLPSVERACFLCFKDFHNATILRNHHNWNFSRNILFPTFYVLLNWWLLLSKTYLVTCYFWLKHVISLFQTSEVNDIKRYQNILWWDLLWCKILLNFIWLTLWFHICPQTNHVGTKFFVSL